MADLVHLTFRKDIKKTHPSSPTIDHWARADYRRMFAMLTIPSEKIALFPLTSPWSTMSQWSDCTSPGKLKLAMSMQLQNIKAMCCFGWQVPNPPKFCTPPCALVHLDFSGI
eukprot:686180-Amphidinium_carterae.2